MGRHLKFVLHTGFGVNMHDTAVHSAVVFRQRQSMPLPLVWSHLGQSGQALVSAQEVLKSSTDVAAIDALTEHYRTAAP